MKKKFADRYNTSKGFFSRVEANSKNTLIFENTNISERYKNEEVKHMDESEIGLYYITNVLFGKYLDRILQKCDTKVLSDTEKRDYDLNPYLVSYNMYGNPDYWWLILLGNRMRNIHEFTKLPDKIYIPNLEDVKSIMKLEMLKNDNIGEVIN